jgi:ParB family chromosome partitioning protein
MLEIEFHQLQRPYDQLRITTAASRRRMLSSLAIDGQQTPVLVVSSQGEQSYVLIDGYQRVAALEELGRDTVEAVVLDLDEASALVFRHRQQRVGRSSALEEAWLLRALTEQHGLSQHDLARRLGHTTSWVSRRLGLVTVLPPSVQELVRQGRFPPHSAGKYLVPLARANTADCEKLARNLAGHPVSTRQMERLYVAWRSGDTEDRARLVNEPLLFLKADEEVRAPEPPHPDTALVKDVTMIGDVSRRVTRRLSRRKRNLELPKELRDVWAGTRQSMDALVGMMKERLDD